MYGHQGKAYGMIAAAYGDPTDGTGMVMITNGCDPSTFNSVARIVRALFTAVYDGWLDDSGAYALSAPVPTPALPPEPTPTAPLKTEPSPTALPEIPQDKAPAFDGDLAITAADWLFQEDTLTQWSDEPKVF